MTTAAGAATFPPRSALRVGVTRAVPALSLVLVAALFAVCHPYTGIRGDASVYMMRVLADLDPAMLGRDLMVVDDGQMRFSLFPALVRPLVAVFGVERTAMAVSALGSAAWLAALALLAQALAPRRIAWAMVTMVAVLPVAYGDMNFGVFSFVETSATPRPWAEAAVLATLAAILAGRPLLAAAALGVAFLIHPLMALAGLGVAVGLALWRLPPRARSAALALGAAAAIGAVVLGWLGVPLLDRLVTRMDPAWFALIAERSPHLLPTLWTSASFAPIIAQAATVLVAAHRAPAAQSRLYVTTLIVAALGLAVAALLADTLHILLLLQLQSWRATWLLGVLGGCALAFCVATLWQDGERGRVVLALLASAWFFQPSVAVVTATAGLALILEFGGGGIVVQRRHAILVGLLVAAGALFWASGPLIGYVAFLRALPAGDQPSLIDPLRNNLHTLPLVVILSAWLVASPSALEQRYGAIVLGIGAVALLAAATWGWDQRGAARAALETRQTVPGFETIAAGRRPEVLWIDDESDAWFALGRPQFFSVQQAVSIVFSQPLATEWTRRADLLIKLGLEPRGVFRPWARLADDDHPQVSQAPLDALCARPDGPGVVLFPLQNGRPALRDMLTWTLPAPLFKVERWSSDETRRIDAFGIVPCAPVAPR